MNRYDALGRCSSVRDANGHLTRYSRNGFGELAQTIDALGGVTTFDYDARGSLVDVMRSDGKGVSHPTRYERDLLGRVSKVIDPLGNETSYAYDSLGHPTRVVDADGLVTSYTYTPTGAPQGIRYDDGRTVDFGYDALGRLVDVKDWLGSTSIKRDAMGRMLSTQDCAGNVVRYEWGMAGELAGLTYPDGGRVSYEYDDCGRLTRLNARHTSVAYEYDHMSRLARKSTSDGLETRYARDAMGRVTSMTHRDAAGELMRLGFGYDAEGNKVRRSVRRRNLPECDGELAYAYDALDRLVGVNRDGSPLRSYGYDAFGNRIWDEQLGERTDYAYDAADRLLHMTRDGRTTDFSYDGRGNLRVVSTGGHDERSYDYDATNRLVRATSVSQGAARTMRYAYDGLGQRILQSLVDERDPEGTQTTRYVHDLSRVGRNLLQRSDDSGCESLVWNGAPVVTFSDSRTKWFACDELGSPLEALSADGGSVGAVGYDEFGQVTGGDPSALSGIGFAAYGLDPVAGTLFAEAREYSPQTGRFVSRDRHASMGGVPQTLNKYSYCWNSPLGYVDVNGLWPIWQDVCDGVESVTESVFEGANEAWNNVSEPVRQVVSEKGTEILNGLRSAAELDFKDMATAAAAATVPLSPWAAAGIYAAGNIPSSVFGVNDISDVAAAFTKSPLGEQALDLASFSRDEYGVYHAKQDCWQKPFGYNDVYDYLFTGLTSAEPYKLSFTAGGTEYTLWLWKGDYFNLGAGAESGIYRGNGFHQQSATDTNLSMKLNLYDKDGNVIFVYDPGQPNWWTTGFNPDVQDAHQKDLIAYGSIDFSANPELWDAFYAKYHGRPGWCFDEERKVAYYAWQ